MDKLNQILKNVLIFLAIFLIINYVSGLFQNKERELIPGSGELVFTTTDTSYDQEEKVMVSVVNNSKNSIVIPNECPNEPFDIFRYENDQWIKKTSSPELDCTNIVPNTLEPGEKIKIAYKNWNHALFSELGRYRIQFTTTINDKEKTFTTNEFVIEKEGLFHQITVGLFYRPIYNGLIFLSYIVPKHDLGLAIILLTLIIRTILLIPSHKAMLSQKRMQNIQPKLNKIKEKHKGDQQKIAMETMAVWKEAKINPVSSCLPILLQFPFLIALFYVIQDGLNPDKAYLLYQQFTNFSVHDINVNFIGILDLTKSNLYVLPLVVGALQFLQMKLAMAGKLPAKDGDKPNEMAIATNMMTYILPVMIAVFTASLPAGVGIYWGVSTTYGIVQQIVINRKSHPKDENEPTVRVINAK